MRYYIDERIPSYIFIWKVSLKTNVAHIASVYMRSIKCDIIN